MDTTFAEFNRQFPDDDACKVYIVSKRWPDGVRCPRCNAKEKVYALKARPFHWTCCNKECGGRKGYRFSVTTHTIFQDTKVSLKIWFQIGYLMLTAKKGISSLQVRRVIFGEKSGTDWRTAWYICHRWRAAMRGDAFPLTGQVEVDETHTGGKAKWRHKSALKRRGGGWDQPTIIGAMARKGSVVCQVIEHAYGPTMNSFVRKVVDRRRVDLVATDEHSGYDRLHMGYNQFPHQTVAHRQGEYVRGVVHTNNLENFWSLLKRGIVGTYHQVKKEYLPLYLNEFSFRHNNRETDDPFALMVTTCSSSR